MRYMVILLQRERDGHGSGPEGTRQLAVGDDLLAVIKHAIAELGLLALDQAHREYHGDAWAREATAHMGPRP